MRNFVAVVFASASLAACGSSNKSTSPSTPVSGTVAGAAFTPADVQAIELSSSTPCGINTGTSTITLGVKALELKMTSYANACGDLTSAICQLHPGQHAVTVLVTKLNMVPPNTAPSTLAGTYNVSPSFMSITPETQNGVPTGLGYVAYAQIDPNCAGTTHPVTTGTVHIAQDGTTIAGDVSLQFDDGSTVAGTFSSPLCSGSLPGGGDVCAIATSQQLCQPSTCP